MRKEEHTYDLTKGLHRRLYQGFVNGQRINSVSVGAEAFFWRLNAIADDFGTFPAEASRCKALAAHKRKEWTPAKIDGFLVELETARLITLYIAEGDYYGSIEGFMRLQPAGKNGRRIKRFPNRGDSGEIQENPRKSCPSGNGDGNGDEDEDENGDGVAASGEAAGTQPATTQPLPPSKRIRWGESTGWTGIDDTDRERWAAAYPACDVTLALAKMHDWLTANPAKARKSNYAKFIARWLGKDQDQGGCTSSGRFRSNGVGSDRSMTGEELARRLAQ